MFKKAKSSIRKYKRTILQQEEKLDIALEKLERISQRLELMEGSRSSFSNAVPSDFDPAIYLVLNRDIAAAGLDPFEHYLRNGSDEGRPYKASYHQDGLLTIHDSSFREDASFKRAYARGLAANEQIEFNWHWRFHVGLWAARCAACLPGDFIECGVNRGFLSSGIMEDLDWNTLDRTFWLLDTFAGIDTEGVSSKENDPGSEERNRLHFESGLYTTDLESVRANFAEWKNAKIIVGAVPGTLKEVTSSQIAFASIDMNTAPPEIAAMEYLWPRFVPGAMIVLDDYAYHGYKPQKLAMDEFARKHDVSILSLPTGQGLIVRPPDR